MQRLAVCLIAVALPVATYAAEPLNLKLPISCTIGETCWVQQYPDHDPSPGVKDYACGAETYDGHDGIDIRIRDTAAKADVIATAAGTVKAVRDGVADHLMLTPEDRKAVGKRECGNGVVISHGDGWETQYCHMRQGSVSVKAGDVVEAGTRLGQVGYSGMAAFPHVHLTVRKDGKSLDPFRPVADETSCGVPQDALWADDTLAALAYEKGSLLRVGFSPNAVEMPQLESGALKEQPASPDWPALVAYGWAINLAQGDEISVSLSGPDGVSASNTVKLDRAKAQYLLFTGKKQPPGGWPKGEYRGTFEVRSGSEVKLTRAWAQRVE